MNFSPLLASRQFLCKQGLKPVCAVVLAGLGLAGCATVAPYQREFLACPAMDLAREDSETAFRAHVHDSREGATGGHGSTGGGCGCN